jgi:dolichol-phosphate mannosyltransferase
VNWLVVPAYNEEANIARLLADLESRRELWSSGGRLLLVDDGSKDATVELAEAHTGELPVEVLRQIPNQGPGAAFDRGFRRALELASDDDLVITLEADTTSDLDALDEMIARARGGADVVLGSTHAEGGGLVNVGFLRRLLSRSASLALGRLGGLDTQTVSNFFRVYRVETLRRAYDRFGDDLIREPGFACKVELLFKLSRLGARIEEVPVVIDWGRREGESKMRITPTIAAYVRVVARQMRSRRTEEAA